MRLYRKYTTESSSTIDAVLAYIYRKQDLLNCCGRYAETVINGLVELNYIKKITSPKGTFYFKTDKSQNFKAIDFAKQYLWAYHNTEFRKIIDGKRYILCFHSDIQNGSGLIEVSVALGKGYV